MLTFNNSFEKKQFYVDQFARHREMDAVIQITGYKNGRGCGIVCTFKINGVDAYDISRDARTWKGGEPVVAHTASIGGWRKLFKGGCS